MPTPSREEQIRNAQMRVAGLFAATVGILIWLFTGDFEAGGLKLIGGIAALVGVGFYAILVATTDRRWLEDLIYTRPVDAVDAAEVDDGDDGDIEHEPDQPGLDHAHVDMPQGGSDRSDLGESPTVYGKAVPVTLRTILDKLGNYGSHDPVGWLNRQLPLGMEAEWLELAQRVEVYGFTAATLLGEKGCVDHTLSKVCFSPAKQRKAFCNALVQMGVLLGVRSGKGGTRYQIQAFGSRLFRYIVWMHKSGILPHGDPPPGDGDEALPPPSPPNWNGA